MGGAVGKGRKRLASPEGLVWSLKLPSGIAPFPSRGRPARVHPRAPPPPTRQPPHRLLDCLNSLSWFQEANLSFPHLGIGGKVFLWKSFRREKENSESRHVVVCVGTGSFGPPRRPTPKCPYHLRAHFQPGLPPKPTAPSCHPDPFAYSDSIQWEKQTRRYSTRGLRLRHDSR